MGYRNVEFVNSLLHHSSFNNASLQEVRISVNSHYIWKGIIILFQFSKYFENFTFKRFQSALAPFDSVSSRAALDLLNGTSTLFENKGISLFERKNNFYLQDIFTIAAEKMLASNNLDNGVQNSPALDDSNDNVILWFLISQTIPFQLNSNSTFGIRKTVRRIVEPSDKRTIFNSKRPLDSDSATVGQLLTMVCS